MTGLDIKDQGRARSGTNYQAVSSPKTDNWQNIVEDRGRLLATLFGEYLVSRHGPLSQPIICLGRTDQPVRLDTDTEF